MTVVLPTGESNAGKAEWSEVYGNDKALKEAIETLQTEFKSAVAPLVLGEKKAITAEQSRESATFGTLATPDEVTIHLPENGLICVTYFAAFKSSVSGAGRAAMFVDGAQVPNNRGEFNEASTISTTLTPLTTTNNSAGLAAWNGAASFNAVMVPNSDTVNLIAESGERKVSVRFRATSGKVTALQRRLIVWTIG